MTRSPRGSVVAQQQARVRCHHAADQRPAQVSTGLLQAASKAALQGSARGKAAGASRPCRDAALHLAGTCGERFRSWQSRRLRPAAAAGAPSALPPPPIGSHTSSQPTRHTLTKLPAFRPAAAHPAEMYLQRNLATVAPPVGRMPLLRWWAVAGCLCLRDHATHPSALLGPPRLAAAALVHTHYARNSVAAAFGG